MKSDVELGSVMVAYGVEGDQIEPSRTRRECELLADIILACRGVQTSASVFDAGMMVKGVYGGVLYRNCKIWDNVAQPIDYSYPLTRGTEHFSFCAAPPRVYEQLQEIIARWRGSRIA